MSSTTDPKNHYHPGPPEPTPEQRLLLMDDVTWEQFIETCALQLQSEGIYQQVIRLGGSGDKGRDICGYTALLPAEDTWDLYQAKYYSGSLSPSQFAPELAKFLWSVFSGAYTRPRCYYICALKIGAKLFDYIQNPESLRKWIIEEWKKNNGDFGTFKQPLSLDIEAFVDAFPMRILQRRTPPELLAIHSRDQDLHWSKFGVLAKRDPNPDVPDALHTSEEKYVAALLGVYAEYDGTLVSSVVDIPSSLRRHFRAQRRLFYCAEGLNRFSRDKLPGAFDNLLDEIELGVSSVVTAPYTNRFTRLQQTLITAGALSVESNPLKARLSTGDLPGGCHHLVNSERLTWMDSDDD